MTSYVSNVGGTGEVGKNSFSPSLLVETEDMHYIVAIYTWL